MHRHLHSAATTVALLFAAMTVDAQAPVPASGLAPDGAALFEKRCTVCHSGADDARAPNPSSFRGGSPEVIVAALTGGSMRYQGLPFSGEERRAIAEYLTGTKIGDSASAFNTGYCTSNPPLKDPFKGPNWIGWSPGTGNTHFQPAQQASLTAAQIPRLTLKWAFGFPESAEAWAQPTIAAGHIFIGSQNGNVYNLDAKTGCIHWTFTGPAGVRCAISIGSSNIAGATGYVLYFPTCAAMCTRSTRTLEN
jgi:polyvinyl alcohol dehydrogenase (cytochrome)